MKLAVTIWAELIATTHVEVPLQPPPDQPVNIINGSAVAVRVTEGVLA